MLDWLEDNRNKFFLILFSIISFTALIYKNVGVGIFCLIPVFTIIYNSIMDPDSEAALQEDKRTKTRHKLKDIFTSALNAAGFTVDDNNELSALECIKANPAAFIFTTKQYRANKEEITKLCNDAAPLFGSSRFDVEEIKTFNDEQLTYEITFYRGRPWDTLTDLNIKYSNLLTEEITYKNIPVGVFENGEIAKVSFDNRNMLLAGLPRSGKSVLLSVIIAGLCQCDNERIIIFSPKMLDFEAYSARAELYSTAETMLDCLERINTDVENRKKYCINKKIKKIEHFKSNLPHTVLIVDEYSVIRAWKTRTPDGKKERKIGEEIEQQLYKIVAQAGFAGYQIILTSQKLSSQVISTDLRDLVAGNVASFSSGSSTSDIMSFGEVAELAKAAEIPITAKGVGILYREGDMPKPAYFKSAMLSYKQERDIAEQNKNKKKKEFTNEHRKLFDDK